MQMLRCVALAAALALLPGAAFSQGKTAPKDAKLYFITPHDGQKVRGGFWVRFGLRNMGVTHAGDEYQNAGHHHLLIDVNDPIDPKEDPAGQVASAFRGRADRNAARASARDAHASTRAG